MINNDFRVGAHGTHYPIFGNQSQAKTSDNRDCDNRSQCFNGPVSNIKTPQPEAIDIFSRLSNLGINQRELALTLGLAENKISKVKSGERQFRASEVDKARRWLEKLEKIEKYDVTAELPDVDPAQDYVPVSVLPSYAGMGGGGTGEGDTQTALVSRFLIESVLRGRAKDFMLIDVRGDSMEPDFRNGDQLLVDCRDVSPSQAGPFALWDGDWGEYVVKNVEKLSDGNVRIFSTNSKYSDTTVRSEHTKIIGRPVWYGRRL